MEQFVKGEKVLIQVVTVWIVFIIGIAVGWLICRDLPLGDLRVDRSDPSSNPLLFLELDTDVQTIAKRKYVTFRVMNENFLPRK